MIELKGPLNKEDVKELQSGTEVLYTGELIAARDAAHKRLVETIKDGGTLPFDLKTALIYYVGPCPAKPGEAIGSAGPTTSTRMDPYTEILLENGLIGMIGKGKRGIEVKKSIQKNHGIYFLALGGAGALLAECIKESKILAYPELGAEAVRLLKVEKFPLIVGIDSLGNDLFDR